MLLDTAYNTYITDIIGLVRSFVIKSIQTIDSINSFLTAGGDILASDPTLWKYYRNVAGLPYSGTSGHFDDPIITVFSLDINTTIPFTPTEMLNNPITHNDFKTYGTAYHTLLALYPEHDMLIRGVLSPVNLTTAIAAENYEIIGFDAALVGAGELSLIKDIQHWVNNYVVRWDISAYAVTDSLYSAANLGILYLNLIPAIVNLRFKNCKTEQAHEFHIWNYLSGYFNLGVYENVIPYPQALFLYRNIDYITANAGKTSTLDFLNEGFAFPFGLQLFNHEIRQDIGESLINLDAGNYKAITNEIKINMYPYGSSNQITATTKFYTPLQATTKLIPQALLNKYNVAQDTEALVLATLATPITEIPTGMLECNIIHSASVNIVNATSEQIHNWLYLAAQNLIQYKYVLTLPSEGVTELNITAQDAAVILMFASAKYFDTTLVTIAAPQVRDIMYQPPVMVAKLKGLLETKNLQGVLFNGETSRSWNRYTDVTTAQTLPTGIQNINAFLTHINKIINNKIQHALLPTLVNDSLAKSEIQFLIKAFYHNPVCQFVDEATYADFFTRLGVDLNTFSKTGLLDIINIISAVYIGLVPETNTLQQPYASMVEILRTLSSYMVQYIDGPSTNDIEPIEWVFTDVAIPSVTIIDLTARIQPGVDSYYYQPILDSVVNAVTTDIMTKENNTYTSTNLVDIVINSGFDISCHVVTQYDNLKNTIGVWPTLL